ncbi:MAG: NAD(P)/FAD-dependent oxidoreductase [Thermaurantiacus sp.]
MADADAAPERGAMAAAAAAGRKTQIVVVGGGAGGLELVRKLGAKHGRTRHDIILIERNRTHIWKPLLHEVAAGALDANLDELGYRAHCRRWGYRFFHGSIADIDRDAREVVLAPMLDEDGQELVAEHRIRYDWLVLAVGAVTNDFGTPGVRDHCLFLDDRDGADRFRSRLLNQCLRVSRRMVTGQGTDERVRVVIVGGGATGVELAAELFNAAAGLSHYGLEVFDESRLDVTLVEAGPRILPALPERISDAAQRELEALGVTVLTATRVAAAEAGAILVDDGRRIEGDLMVWAAGVRGADVLDGIGGLETTRNRQIVVRDTLQTTSDERIFAMGDCAFFQAEGAERPIPPRAQAAHQMAETVFRNLVAAQAGRPLKPFVYRDRGSLVSLSRYSTVGSLMGNLSGRSMAVEGMVARLMYLSLYRMHLLAIHGWWKGWALILVGHVNAVVRPKLKLH